MRKGLITGINNSKNLMWIKIKADEDVIYHVNKIAILVDEKFREGIFYPDKKVRYRDFIGKRFSIQLDGYDWVILVFNKNVLDFILLKRSPYFDRVKKLLPKHFRIMKAKKRL